VSWPPDIEPIILPIENVGENIEYILALLVGCEISPTCIRAITPHGFNPTGHQFDPIDEGADDPQNALQKMTLHTL
jgi:hypothetical protein